MKVLRTILTVVHLLVLMALLGIFLNDYIRPLHFPYFNLLSLGFPILFGVYLILTIGWILSFRKRSVVFLLVGLVFILPVRRWVNMSDTVDKPSNLKIISYNVKGTTIDREGIERFLKNTDADIAFIQERGYSNLDVEQFPHHFNSVMINQVLSKHEILHSEELFDPEETQHATVTDIAVKGRRIRFINIYLEPFSFEKKMFKVNEDSEENKRGLRRILGRLLLIFKAHDRQVNRIHSAVQDSPYPVVVLGDMNAVPNSYEYYKVSTGLKDVFLEVGKGSATSFHDYKFPLRLDYVFTSQELEPVRYTVKRDIKYSDHYPIEVELQIP